MAIRPCLSMALRLFALFFLAGWGLTAAAWIVYATLSTYMALSDFGRIILHAGTVTFLLMAYVMGLWYLDDRRTTWKLTHAGIEVWRSGSIQHHCAWPDVTRIIERTHGIAFVSRTPPTYSRLAFVPPAQTVALSEAWKRATAQDPLLAPAPRVR